MFFNLNLVRCLHLEMNSDRLFRSVRWSACKMASFSARQRLQRLAPLLNAAALHMMDQDMSGSIPLFLLSHTALESSVASDGLSFL